jgi:hypothetical protein
MPIADQGVAKKVNSLLIKSRTLAYSIKTKRFSGKLKG